MNNKITILIAIIATMMVIGGSTSTTISALTDKQKYDQGLADVFNIGHNLTKTIEIMNNETAFDPHSDAYKNGFIAAFDSEHGLKMPYYDYESHKLFNVPLTLHKVDISLFNTQ